MYKASYQYHDRKVDLDCELLGEHRRDIGIALAAHPEKRLTVLKMRGPAGSVAADEMDDQTFVIDRIGQAEMQRELHGTLADALKTA